MNQHSPVLKYRPEIDGLRAVAVMPVILFHAGLPMFSGGFVGVDIFFVISGFLITSILKGELEQGVFSVARFYERRARRILPALFAVILVCVPLAWAWMLTDELKHFSKSLISVALFGSNVFFWRSSDYFARDSEQYPLLHTWSLSVEEQFYVLFPVLLLVSWRFLVTKVIWIVIAVAIVSFFLSEWGWRNSPVANFFLLPGRAWELMAGSLLAFGHERIALREKPMLAETAAGVGLLLIVGSIAAFDSTTPFPSAYALMPVTGAVLVIQYANGCNVVGRLLRSWPFVGVGLISYSAYLWHQPVLVALRRTMDSVHDLPLFVGVGVLLTLVLATGSFYIVEKPFRRMKSRRVLWHAGLSLVMLIGIAGAMMYTADFQVRPIFTVIEHDPQARVYADWVDQKKTNHFCSAKEDAFGVIFCQMGDLDRAQLDVILWGDSLAGALASGLDQALRQQGLKGMVFVANGCPPILGLSCSSTAGCTERTHAHVLEEVTAVAGKPVVLLFGNVEGGSKNKGCRIDGAAPSWGAAKLKIGEAARLLAATGKRLVFV